MKNIIYLLLLISTISFGQVFSEKDVEVCNSKFQLVIDKKLENLKIGDLVAEVGKTFLNTDYVAHTLETKGDEELVINLTGLDCTTFLETAVTFARSIKKQKFTFEDYKNELTYIRYRDGIIDGYPSRLHYFSDWIFSNTKKGIVKDVTKEIGGKAIKFNVGFMSKNPDSYQMLKSNPVYIPVISSQEKEINKREYFYIPKSGVNNFESKIQNGDLIAISTNLKGLDISHVGIAVKMSDGEIHFMHAPIVGSKVQITETTLHEYLSKIKKHTGIIVLRPLEP
ncbi:MAG: DUF1460 domain-containing protein [Ignavibacteria bacterium]|nr:DUF1460 domain-containing protein [Ignavibacteria bacterium]